MTEAIIYVHAKFEGYNLMYTDFLKAMFVAQTKSPSKKYLLMKMRRKEHNTKKK